MFEVFTCLMDCAYNICMYRNTLVVLELNLNYEKIKIFLTLCNILCKGAGAPSTHRRAIIKYLGRGLRLHTAGPS